MSINIIIDNDYAELITSLKQTVRIARLKAHRAVNTELIKLYWTIGRELLARQKVEAWGSKYLEQVSRDLKLAFPGMQGFSRRNLEYMRKFNMLFNGPSIAQQPAAQLGWGSLMILMDNNLCVSEINWYAQRAIEQGWSRNILSMMIKSDLHARQKEAPKITNFKQTLPALQSDMAQELFQDPYNFEFLQVERPVKERDIEDALVTNIRDFLLQLGKGFAFVGSQYKLVVGGDEFFIDMLFFNMDLNCYVVIELKAGKFQPSDSGQLKFYLTAINRQLKKTQHAPTIGILLCESKNKIVAEFSLDGVDEPIGISQYELGAALTQHLKITKGKEAKEVEENIKGET